MAGDWIKVQKDTPDKPEVLAIASRMNLDPDAVVGKLIRIWSWFDTHTIDGNARSVTYSFVDRLTGVTGFAEQVSLVGWLEQNGSELTLPNFGYHNGETAKTRALGKKRTEKYRNNAISDGGRNDVSVTNSSPEKRREEKKKEEYISQDKPAKPSRKTSIPDNFKISERVSRWATEKGFDRLDEHLDAFTRKAKMNAYTYTDWDLAFMEAIREDWAKIRGKQSYAQQAADIARVTVPGPTEPDPALLKIQQDREKSVPMPAHIRQQINQVLRKA